MTRAAASSRLLFGLVFAVLLYGPRALAQRPTRPPAPPADLEQAAREGRELVANLLAARPAENSTNVGRLRIRNAEGDERDVRVRFEITVTPTNWFTVYETVSNDAPAVRLVVSHPPGRPVEYLLADPASANPRLIAGQDTMAPFAGSDFWIADLGLEFLGWPKQLLLRRELRRSQSCDVLESANPDPSPDGYAKVVAWIERESGAIVHAEAFNARGERIKKFDPKGVKKVAGRYQLEEMEIDNSRANSRSLIRFDLDN